MSVPTENLPKTPRIAVVVASLNRAEEIGYLLDRLRAQTLKPSKIVLSVTGSNDLPQNLTEDVVVVMGSKGLPVQRNRGLDALAPDGCDIVVFYDDDFVPGLTSLEAMAKVFGDHADVLGITGYVIADGINGPGFSHQESCEKIDAHPIPKPQEARIDREVPSLYGCNMAMRYAAIGSARFDERLPLYAWQEDLDFSRRLGTQCEPKR